MVFIDYREALIFGICLAVVLLGIWLFRILHLVRKPLVRLSLRLIAMSIISLGSVPLMLFGLFASWTSKTISSPSFSPDGNHAFRVIDEDAGALGGGSVVRVYAYHGLWNSTVLTGDWKAVEAKDVHWTTDKELLIRYPLYPDLVRPTCTNFGKIKVSCVPVPTEYLNSTR